MEGKWTRDTKNIVKMLANFAPNPLPNGVRKPELINTAKPLKGAPAPKESAGEEAIKKALETPGEIAYEYTGGRADKPAQMVAYRSAGWNPTSGAIRFTKEEWDAMIAEYEASKDVLAAEKPDGGDDADTGELGPPPLDLNAPAVDQEAAKPWLEQQSYSGIAQQTAILNEMGIEGEDVEAFIKSNQRQMRGLGHRTLIFKAASEAFGYRDATPDELEQAAQDLTDAQNRAMILAHQVKNKSVDCDSMPETDRSFLMNCVRLRGSGQSRGVYFKGGGDCAGELGSIGGDQLTSGGDVYGLKVGTEKSPIYQLIDGLDEVKCEVDGKEKALVPRGRLGSAAANQFNAINGEMNEYYADLAHLLFVKNDTKAFKKAYRQMVSEMGNKHNVKLFLQVAEGKAAGDIDQLEVGSMAEEGSIELVDDIAEEFGETPDQKKALQWLITKNLINFKDMVESLPSGFAYRKVGDKGAGITDDGRSVNADIEAECAKGDAGGVYSRLAVNKKYDIKGDRQTEDPACFRASVKDDRGGPWVETGKRSQGKLRALENEAVNEVRDKQADFIAQIAKADGVDLPDDWRTQAETFRRNEVEYVDDMIATVGQIDPGALKDVSDTKKSSLAYEELERYSQFSDKVKEYNKEKDKKKKARLKAELQTAFTQGYRAKNKNKPGMRYNMAIEAAVTGMSTEREAFVLTGEQGTFMGLESDVAGAAVGQIIGGAKMEFTSTKTKFMSEEGKELCNVSLRRKDATASQFLVISKEFARSNLKPVSPTGKNESLRPEDFVRQLQELIKGIDKVSFV